MFILFPVALFTIDALITDPKLGLLFYQYDRTLINVFRRLIEVG